MYLSRRRFVLGSGVAGLLAARARLTWPIQAAHTAEPEWQASAELLGRLPRLLELASVPGLAVGLIRNGRVWQRGFGCAINETALPVTEQTVFEAGSLGKPIFAYAVMRLVQAGLLELDRPLHEYLPLPDATTPRMKRVTTRQVLSHTTGLPNWRRDPAPLDPAFEPGQEFRYSGEAYFYLQRVAEALSGKPFARLMREQVLEPIGMTQSSYVWLATLDSRMAAGYDGHRKRLDVQGAIGRRTQAIAQEWGKPLSEWRYEDSARAVPLVSPDWPVLPLYMVPNAGTSLLTTVSDYARFLIRLVAKPPAQGLDLDEGTLGAMMSPHVRLNSALDWGLGWGIQHDEHGELLWHWGANNSFRNFVIADPMNGRAIVVLTNSENGTRLCERVIVSVTGHDHPIFLWI